LGVFSPSLFFAIVTIYFSRPSMKSRALSPALAAAALFVLVCAVCAAAAPVPASLPASAAGFYPSVALVATEFGAVGDNSTLNTLALQKAIEAAAATPGGAIVILPGPAVYRTGTLYLRSNVYLYFEAGAFLQATANSDDYDADWDKWDVVRGEGAVNTGLLGSALDSDADSAARGGVVGPMWNMIASYDAAQDQLVPVMWQGVRGCRGECRPRGVAFVDCVNVTVASVAIRDSAGVCFSSLKSAFLFAQ
jgi:polygalacturonase